MTGVVRLVFPCEVRVPMAGVVRLVFPCEVRVPMTGVVRLVFPCEVRVPMTGVVRLVFPCEVRVPMTGVVRLVFPCEVRVPMTGVVRLVFPCEVRVPMTGVVRLVFPCEVRVRAYDNGQPSRDSITTVKIYLNRNLHCPRWNSDNVRADIMETLDLGSEVGRVEAHDDDTQVRGARRGVRGRPGQSSLMYVYVGLYFRHKTCIIQITVHSKLPMLCSALILTC